jgi:hypothetical protein
VCDAMGDGKGDATVKCCGGGLRTGWRPQRWPEGPDGRLSTASLRRRETEMEYGMAAGGVVSRLLLLLGGARELSGVKAVGALGRHVTMRLCLVTNHTVRQ